MRKLLLLFALLFSLLPAPEAIAQFEIEREPINYYEAEADNVISRLQQRIDAGDAKLKFDSRTGYIRSVLAELQVPISSQGLVFSKTSLQLRRISPQTPRSVFFNDDVYIGYVIAGDVLEISAVDPQLGAVFYTLDQKSSPKPTFVRQKYKCTQCHAGSLTQRVPGHTVRSVYAAADGRPLLNHGSYISDIKSPLQERWGGWYVTGTHGSERHLGNISLRATEKPETIDLLRGANVTSLAGRFQEDRYLSMHSDIVALMVLEHQTQAHNAITKANYQGRWTMRETEQVNKSLGRPEDYESESVKRRYDNAAKSVVEHLLFVDEYRLRDRVQGTSGFAEEFAKRGPRDRQGRSLRDFDLHRRLFRYPCSYLIYSEAFDRLPAPVKERVYRRLWDVFHSEHKNDVFAHINKADRRAIVAILRDTKQDLPDYWYASE